MQYAAERGLVTVATGERYVNMAVNLLKSYRLNSKNPLPFCLITDGEYENNKLFDDVVILSECRHNTLDKIEIIKHSPYAKNLFIESDILVYRDINGFFDYFVGAGNCFSVFGECHDLSENRGFFIKNGLPADLSSVKYSMTFHGGIYYVDNSERNKLDELYATAQEVIRRNNDIDFFCGVGNEVKYGFVIPNDETVLSLSMALNDLKPTFPEGDQYKCSNRLFCVYPYCYNYNHKLKLNIKNSVLEYDFEGEWVTGVYMIHFGNYYTKKYLYQREIYRLDKMTYKTNSKSLIGLITLFMYEKARGVLAFFKHKVFKL